MVRGVRSMEERNVNAMGNCFKHDLTRTEVVSMMLAGNHRHEEHVKYEYCHSENSLCVTTPGDTQLMILLTTLVNNNTTFLAGT